MPSLSIADIEIGERHRKDHGDLNELAESIREQGLLQPIGVTEDNHLVFGERRLRAARDILGWSEIECRTVNVTSIAAGEWAENELRKNFTPSERVAILQTIKRKPRGDQRRSQNFVTADTAAKMAGFGNRETARQAETVVARGVSQLVQTMDSGGAAISVAAKVASLEPEQQTAVLAIHTEGGAETLREALETVSPQTSQTSHVGLASLQQTWRQADDVVRRQFLRWLGETDPHALRTALGETGK
jgi:hypothetical protein